MVKVIWTDLALADLKAIFNYIKLDSPKNAEKVGSRLLNRVEVLREFPQSGRVVPEVNRIEIRELIQWNYRIVYRVISPNEIWILRIHHSSRQIQSVS